MSIPLFRRRLTAPLAILGLVAALAGGLWLVARTWPASTAFARTFGRPLPPGAVTFAPTVAPPTGSPPPTPASVTPPLSLLAAPGYLSCLGMRFDPVDTTDPSAVSVISSEQALSTAWRYMPDLKSANILDVSLGRMGNIAGSGVTATALAGDPLVWMVSFAGVQSVSSGPPGAAHHTANDFSVVIDAAGAQPMMAFPLCLDARPPTQTP
jgi:hypothetical protein